MTSTTRHGADRLVATLRDPGVVVHWRPCDWELLMRQARQADLVARIASVIDRGGFGACVPPELRQHFDGFARLVAAQHAEVRREAEHLLAVLRPLGLPVVLLKGAAYVVSSLPPAAGRLFTDVDLLVPKTSLGQVESELMLAGWLSGGLSAYDERYYRQWMHELPPMEHLRRRTALDVHHNILPTTARLKPDPAKILAHAREVDHLPGIQVLAPVDMVLHSITHLVHNDDLSHGLRDLSDIDLLLRHFAESEPDFWRRLVERARELDLGRPLYHGLRCVQELLGTPVPGQTQSALRADAPAAPVNRFMDALWRRALGSQHPTAALPLTPAALFLLYVRAHWLRMPPLLLARHLATKAWMRSRPKAEAAV